MLSEDAPSRTILSAGAGTFAVTRITETIGALIEGDITPEAVAENWAQITDPTNAEILENAFDQTRKYALRAAKAKGVALDW